MATTYVLRPGSDNLIRLKDLTNEAAGGGLIDTGDPVAQVEDASGNPIGSSVTVAFTGTSGLYEGIADATAVPLVADTWYRIRITMTTPLDRVWLVPAVARYGG